jgi:hypothetical protein
MITKGTLVKRKYDSYLSHIKKEVIERDYPPQGAVCVVIAGPFEKDLFTQMRVSMIDANIALKRAVSVLHDGALYNDCELAAFEKIKGSGRELL